MDNNDFELLLKIGVVKELFKKGFITESQTEKTIQLLKKDHEKQLCRTNK